jgi:hypothetical protein
MFADLLITRDFVQDDLDLDLADEAGEDKIAPPEPLVEKFFVVHLSVVGVVSASQVCRCRGPVLEDLLAVWHGAGAVCPFMGNRSVLGHVIVGVGSKGTALNLA